MLLQQMAARARSSRQGRSCCPWCHEQCAKGLFVRYGQCGRVHFKDGAARRFSTSHRVTGRPGDRCAPCRSRSWHQDVHGDTGWHSGRFHWKHSQAALAQTPAPVCVPGMGGLCCRRASGSARTPTTGRSTPGGGSGSSLRPEASATPTTAQPGGRSTCPPRCSVARSGAMGRYAVAIDPGQGAGRIAAVGRRKLEANG